MTMNSMDMTQWAGECEATNISCGMWLSLEGRAVTQQLSPTKWLGHLSVEGSQIVFKLKSQ